MPTTFDTLAAEGFAVLLDQYGEAITYTPLGGSATAIAAIVERPAPEEMGPRDARIETAFVLRVATADLPTAKQGDTAVVARKKGVTGDTLTVTVRRIGTQDGGAWELHTQ